MNTHLKKHTNMDQLLVKEVHSLQPLLDNSIQVRPEKLRDLLQKLEQEKDEDDVCQEETICKLNFKSWVYRRMGEWDKAYEINCKVGRTADLIQADLFNKAINASIGWSLGKNTQAEQSLEEIRQFKSNPDFHRILARFKATLAYLYSRLAEPEYISKAVELLEEAIEVNQENVYWKLRLGLEYRRLTRLNTSSRARNEPVVEDNTTARYSALYIVQRGHQILTEVTLSTDKPRIVGPAFAELACLCWVAKLMLGGTEFMNIFGEEKFHIIISRFLNKALEFDGSSPWVLSRYATFLKSSNTDEAIAVLERCLRSKQHTSTFTELGRCYIKKASEYRKMSDIDRENECLEQAAEYLNRAVDYSHSTNISAMFELAILYKSRGRLDESLELFNRLLNLQFEGNLFTVIQSCLQSAVCYSVKGQLEHVLDKLNKAIFLSVTCHLQHETIGSLERDFMEIRQKLEKTNILTCQDERIKLIFQLAENLHEAREIAADIYKINNNKLDEATIINKLIGYMEMKDPEKGIIALNLLSIHPDNAEFSIKPSDEMKKARRSLLISAAEFRLMNGSSDYQAVFRHIFQKSHLRSPDKRSSAAAAGTPAFDILLLHDDEKGNPQMSSTRERVLPVFRDLFGLHVTNNMQEPMTSARVEEISLVVVVLDGFTRSGRFVTTLRTVASLKSRKVLLVVAGETRPDIPDFLRRFRQVRCPPLPNLAQLPDMKSRAGPETRAGYNKQQVTDLMTFFCSLVDVEYPIQ